MDCAACHTPENWTSLKSEMAFNHDTTGFALDGVHTDTDCKLCHTSLVFDQTPNDCMSCHQDVHSQSVGNDCARCHNTDSWLVDNIPELHEENGFPLVGSHVGLSCVDCHISETNSRFDRVGNDCFSCHKNDYISAQDPNHQLSGFSTNCIECHNPMGFGWETEVVDHDFFPLVLGHDNLSCNECHSTSNFSDVSADCFECHQQDYQNTSDPSHQATGYSTDCASCHTLDPGWTPATFDHDAQYFPIYSGEHEGEWSACVDCHKNPSNYADFTCFQCHLNPETDEDHLGISGYTYESNACLVCHPQGNSDGAFDHSSTGFPIQGQHVGVDCIECHADGYAGTRSECRSCHLDDYKATTNPVHFDVQFPLACDQCHTENGWEPADFNHDAFFFPIYSGNHQGTWSDCTTCHTSPSDYSVFSCTVCHGKSDTDGEHGGVGGYQYESNACLACHPDGSE